MQTGRLLQRQSILVDRPESWPSEGLTKAQVSWPQRQVPRRGTGAWVHRELDQVPKQKKVLPVGRRGVRLLRFLISCFPLAVRP